MTDKKTIIFKRRWREELEAITDEGKLIFEFTIGRFHVYFPTQERWIAQVPLWARDRWEEYKNACEAWCQRERTPISFVNDAHVYYEKNEEKESE